MNDHAFTLAGTELVARCDKTLWLPHSRTLVVSDLHLGKSERMARRGGPLLPPYETAATLDRLDAAIEATGPRMVLCLGDSFDDLLSAEAMEERHRLHLVRMQAGRDWVWIEGNHDPGPTDIGGRHVVEITLEGVTFRHIADPSATAEVSGHYHPKARVPRAGGARPAFLIDRQRVIMPAFGTYTGGLSGQDRAFGPLMAGDALAILTGRRCVAVPLAACA